MLPGIRVDPKFVELTADVLIKIIYETWANNKWLILGRLKALHIVPFAPVVYQVILGPGIGQFREFESPRVHKFVGICSCAQIDLGKRKSAS